MKDNVIDRIITNNTTHSVYDFTGGSIQVSVSKYSRRLDIQLVLYFGFNASRNPISEKFNINEDDMKKFSSDLLERGKQYLDSLKIKENRLSYADLRTNVVRVTPNGSDNDNVDSDSVDRVDSDRDTIVISDANNGTDNNYTPYIPTAKEFMEVWNENAQRVGLNKIRVMNSSRHKQLKVRINSNNNFLDDLLECLEIGSRSDLIQKGSWFGLDWLLKNDINYSKVLEGNYDNKN